MLQLNALFIFLPWLQQQMTVLICDPQILIAPTHEKESALLSCLCHSPHTSLSDQAGEILFLPL